MDEMYDVVNREVGDEWLEDESLILWQVERAEEI